MPLEQKTAWLAQNQTKFAAELLDLAEAHSRTPDALKLASRAIIQRMISAQNAMGLLGSQMPAQFDVRLDLMTLLRAMYDTHLQALYMLADPPCAGDRAQRFLDYDAVDKLDLLRLWKNNRASFSEEMLRRVRASETSNDDIARMESIARKFETPPGSKRPYQDSWWGGNLHMLASDKAVELVAEYEIVQRLLSGALHANPATILWPGSALPADLSVLGAGNLTLRVAGRLAACRGASISSTMETVLKSAWAPIL